MAKKAFQAESKRLLDMMIHSIYTHKEIFIRELISNASDAIDKLYYNSLKDQIAGIDRNDFFIKITPDEAARTLTIQDNGIGMSVEELESNLGTIALSGSHSFKNDEEVVAAGAEGTDIDIIGQFGVGFYSAFMVASEIQVISKQYGSDQAYAWTSEGADGYDISEAEMDGHGTIIILTLKTDVLSEGEEENYSEYLKEYTLRSLIKKYSDYIRYPIKMDIEKSRLIEEPEDESANAAADDASEDDAAKEPAEPKEPQYEEYIEEETINSMVPLWKRMKSDITKEEYNGFYKDKFMDYQDPIKTIHTGVEGIVSYDALLFIPARTPYNYYTKDYEKGLQLYSSGVMIMDKCADLLPDYFSFVKGLVDSQDLSLNISRELLQHDRQLKAIEQRLEKKVKSELLDMLKSDRENYDEFFKNFGVQIKFGIYNDYGQKKDFLSDLLVYYSAKEKKLITLDEYVAAMPEDQTAIYYATGESIDQVDRLPQTEVLKDKEYDILYGTDEVDEFCFKILETYKEKPIKNISEGDLGIEETEEEKKQTEALEVSNKEIIEALKTALADKVSDVRLSSRIKSYPVVLVAGDGMSLEMEKIMNKMPGGPGMPMKATRILEINATHPIIDSLKKAHDKGEEELAKYASIIYDMGVMLAGLEVDDSGDFVKAVASLM
ncbi:MAG: molecular chaperone HtpG [Clostridiales Family XIII bacterium]|nr:molecular chaperone HtpG [Clostridiales Family XIII bacterium]